MSSGLCAPFLIMLAQGAALGLGTLGLFVIASGLTSMLSGVVCGRWSDISSRQVMLASSVAVSGLCVVSALLARFHVESLAVFMLLYFVLSVIHEGVHVARKTYVLDLAGG